MKKLFWCLLCSLWLASPVLASVPTYLNEVDVNLSPKEIEALRLATEWSDKPIKPVHLGNGKVAYVFGASLPSVICAPWQICDIELEPGEAIQDLLVGDSQRWLIETGSSGTSRGQAEHVFIKPVDAGLLTNLVITTNRRVYNVKLVSQQSGHTPYIGFLYPDQAMALKRQSQKDQTWQVAHINGASYDISSLNFKYKVEGKAAWRPVQVYDDGRQLYLKLPERVAVGEIPVLLVMNGKQETLVNYRFKNHTFEVDGIFDTVVLVLGVGRNQQKVTIKREID